jgi:hypothetical protein
MASGKNHAYIVQVDGQFKVRPAVASVDQGQHQRFCIRNVCGWPARVEVDPAMVHANTPKSRNVADGTPVDFRLAADASGAFPYEVWVDLDGVWVPAQGESDPMIIIDP